MSGAAHGSAPGGVPSGPAARLAPEAKVAATVAFTVAVCVTPGAAGWALAADAATVAAVALSAGVSVRRLLPRFAVEAPFVLAAVLLALTGPGPRTVVVGLSLSRPGVAAGLHLLVKATLGVAATAVLGATTTPADIVSGLERLRVPGAVCAVAAFGLRYAETLAAEGRRLQTARLTRGADPGRTARARAALAATGTLATRAWERGERAHLSMVARGFTGSVPRTRRAPGEGPTWATFVLLPPVAVAVAFAAAARLAVP